MRDLKCRDIMTKYLKMCKEDCTVQEATKIMKDLNCGIVPVVDTNNEIKGLVTDRDIALYLGEVDKQPDKVYLSDFMSKDIICCHADDDINCAVEKMKEYKVRRVPIVDNHNRMIGIISLGDIAVIAHEEHKTFEALENISFPISGAK